MKVLLSEFGNDNWSVKEKEYNGLIYGIIEVGFIEFHIYNEKINGISYRPDLFFPKNVIKGIVMPWKGIIWPYKDVIMPWIFKNREISKVECRTCL